MGRVFSSRLTTPVVSFAEAVKGQQRKQAQQNQTPTATPEGTEKTESKAQKRRGINRSSQAEQQVTAVCPHWTCLKLQQLCRKS
jgi:hypothetical protein